MNKNHICAHFLLLIIFIANNISAQSVSTESLAYNAVTVDLPILANSETPKAILSESGRIIYGSDALYQWQDQTITSFPNSSLSNKRLIPYFIFDNNLIIGLAKAESLDNPNEVFIYENNQISSLDLSANFQAILNLSANSSKTIVGFGLNKQNKLKGFVIINNEIAVKNNLYDLVTDANIFYFRKQNKNNEKLFDTFRSKNTRISKINQARLVKIDSYEQIQNAKVLAEIDQDNLLLEVKAFSDERNQNFVSLQSLKNNRNAKLIVKETKVNSSSKNIHSFSAEEGFGVASNRIFYNFDNFFLNSNKNIIPTTGFLFNLINYKATKLSKIFDNSNLACPAKYLSSNSNGEILVFAFSSASLFCSAPSADQSSKYYQLFLLRKNS